MAAVPARVAGVERIAIVTPKASEATLAAAHALGIDEVYAVGGAQAVAALAFGTETIAPVDKIVGPGNRWVTAAKLLVSSHVGDRPSGRAERGRPDRRRLGRSRPLRRRSARAGRARPGQRGDPAQPRSRALRSRYAISSPAPTTSRSATCPRSTRRSRSRRPTRRSTSSSGSQTRSRCSTRIRNAGTVFVRTSAVVGDYAAGATHILPTGGLARGSGGLGLETFLKPDPARPRHRPRACARDRAAARPPRRAAAACGRAGAGVRAQPLPEGFRAYDVVAVVGGRGRAARPAAGADPALRPEHAARSRACRRCRSAESFARLQEYPDGTFSGAAARPPPAIAASRPSRW